MFRQNQALRSGVAAAGTPVTMRQQTGRGIGGPHAPALLKEAAAVPRELSGQAHLVRPLTPPHFRIFGASLAELPSVA